MKRSVFRVSERLGYEPTMIPTLFLELTYHLEHHLYPQVPSHNLPKLAARLEPYFRQTGVVPRRVPSVGLAETRRWRARALSRKS